jgi:hypothetical protein
MTDAMKRLPRFVPKFGITLVEELLRHIEFACGPFGPGQREELGVHVGFGPLSFFTFVLASKLGVL